LNAKTNNKPKMFVLNTIKGKGVSFMENNNAWHSKCPDEKLYNLAMSELI
jgi:transketolase